MKKEYPSTSRSKVRNIADLRAGFDRGGDPCSSETLITRLSLRIALITSLLLRLRLMVNTFMGGVPEYVLELL